MMETMVEGYASGSTPPLPSVQHGLREQLDRD